MATTQMDWLLIGGMVALISLSAVSLWHSRKVKLSQDMLVEGIANAFGVLNEQLKSVEQIPQILQDLNLGGVQLMPQKTLGETIMENVMAHFFSSNQKTKTIESEEPAEAWPDASQPENEPGDSPVLTSQTPL